KIIEVGKVLDGGIALLRCATDLQDLAQQHGTVPLPPYMKRDATEEDIQRYQTEFAAQAGSVAAPTASLNLTTGILHRLEQNGVTICRMTLHVGMGTFLPIRSDEV